jgi:hypothetical protein
VLAGADAAFIEIPDEWECESATSEISTPAPDKVFIRCHVITIGILSRLRDVSYSVSIIESITLTLALLTMASNS